MFTKALLLLLCSYVLPISGGFAQMISWIQGARIAGIANADVALQGPWNTAGNPAGIATLSAPVISFALERRFMVKALDSRAFTATLPTGKHVLGASVNFFGSHLYQQHQATLACARAFSAKLQIGFRINYHGIKLAGHPGEQAWTAGAGIQYSPLPRLRLGAALFNPRAAEFTGALYARIPVIFSLGASWAFSEQVLAFFELERISGFPAAVHTGFEYGLHDSLFIRAGVASSPFRQYGGLGIRYKQLHIDLSAASHLELGFTPRISLSYEF